MKTVTLLFFFLSTASFSSAHNFHHPNELIDQIKTSLEPEKEIYNAYCANCHAKEPLIEMGAPKFRHLLDWQVILKKDKALIFNNVNEGMNAMPPRGGCFECSDELLKKTIDYMLPKKN